MIKHHSVDKLRITRIFTPYLPIIFTYIFGMFFFTGFRLFILLMMYSHFQTPRMLYFIVNAFGYGFIFDTVISGYLLLIPLVLVGIQHLLGQNYRPIFIFSKYWLIILYWLAFALCTIDIPYFNHYFTRLDIAVFQWVDYPKLMLGMIIREIRYALFMILFIAISFAWIIVQRKILKTQNNNEYSYSVKRNLFNQILTRLVVFLFMAGICLLGIRGRIEKIAHKNWNSLFFESSLF